MTCSNELTLSMYADGELPRPEADQVAAHLKTCTACDALVSALEVENAVLVEVLGAVETQVLPVAAHPSTWLWGSLAACALTPVMFGWGMQALPDVPPGLGWLETLVRAEGLFALLRGLFHVFSGVSDMLLPMAGFVATLVVALGLLGLPTLNRLALAGRGVALALLLVITSPTAGHAADVRIEEDGLVRIAADEVIDDTVFLSGETVLVEGVVNGDVFAFAERVEITGKVNGNVYSAAETIEISGTVSGNVHAVGKDVELNAKIGGSAYLVGENVTLTEGSELSHEGSFAGGTIRVHGRVGRGLRIAAEKIEIHGKVERSVKAHAEHFTLSSTGSVGGNIELTVPSEDLVDIDQGATVGGTTTIEIKEKEKNDFVRGSFYFGLLARAIALLIVGFLFVTFLPSLVPRLPDSSPEVLRNMGIGFLGLVATPVAMFFAAITVIGIPVAMLLGMLYAVLAYIATLVVAYFVAQKFLGSENKRVILGTALSLIIILIVVELPLVGLGLNFLVHLFGMGCLLVHLKNRYVATRTVQ